MIVGVGERLGDQAHCETTTFHTVFVNALRRSHDNSRSARDMNMRVTLHLAKCAPKLEVASDCRRYPRT